MEVKGRRTEAAQLLGWGRTTLWRKMKGHGIGYRISGIGKKIQRPPSDT
jgi:DNA-binding NtrC family response regulator